jgi:hypothetical protein
MTYGISGAGEYSPQPRREEDLTTRVAKLKGYLIDVAHLSKDPKARRHAKADLATLDGTRDPRVLNLLEIKWGRG